jgi:hypothetical protein
LAESRVEHEGVDDSRFIAYRYGIAEPEHEDLSHVEVHDIHVTEQRFGYGDAVVRSISNDVERAMPVPPPHPEQPVVDCVYHYCKNKVSKLIYLFIG